jgi:hypothetical protein
MFVEWQFDIIEFAIVLMSGGRITPYVLVHLSREIIYILDYLPTTTVSLPES